MSKWNRREFAKLGMAGAAAGLGLGLPASLEAQAAGGERPAALKSEFLLDMILETGGLGSGPVGSRNVVAVTGLGALVRTHGARFEADKVIAVVLVIAAVSDQLAAGFL